MKENATDYQYASNNLTICICTFQMAPYENVFRGGKIFGITNFEDKFYTEKEELKTTKELP